jgi:hypothetical protein
MQAWLCSRRSEARVIFGRHNHDGVFAMQRHTLWPLLLSFAHDLAEMCLRVLKLPGPELAMSGFRRPFDCVVTPRRSLSHVRAPKLYRLV